MQGKKMSTSFESQEAALDVAKQALLGAQVDYPGALAIGEYSVGLVGMPAFWPNPDSERDNWNVKSTKPDFEDEQYHLTVGEVIHDLRIFNYVHGEGTFVLVEFYLSAEGDFKWWGSRDSDVRAGEFGPGNVAEELRMFPRFAEFIPQWMRVRLGDDWESHALSR
ncbi:hypothetical protein [Galactobacter valiniphilus]|uniref:hypothetical protein n=1 Tax=Galactobacter valiniphilus TaxID=2676122 RepID=UPI0011C4607A|nr:hypothetical protein [Galactobacter valiniphilus]